MHSTRLSLLAAGALLTWLAVACGGSDATQVNSPANVTSASADIPSAPPDTAGPPTTPTAPVTPPPTASATATPPEPPSERMMVPMVLRLQGPDPVPTSGEIRLSLEIIAREVIKLPLTVRIKLPKGATLGSGQAEEILQIGQAGTTRREFAVRLTGALTEPIVVTAETKDASGASAMRAERKYPESSAAAPTPGGGTMGKPPVPRPPGPPKK